MIKCLWCRKFKCRTPKVLMQHIQVIHPEEYKRMMWAYGSGPGTLAGDDDL